MSKSREPLELRTLTTADEAAFFQGLTHWSVEDRAWFTFSYKDGMSYAELLEILRKEEQGIDLAPGRVQHTMLYGFVDRKIVGRVSVRHELNENLRRRGGNIGYSVAEKYRGKGYATEMVRQALQFCKGLGLQKIMISCADTNIPSWKIIESFSGVLEDKVWDDEENEMLRRYWITLADSLG